MTKLPPRTRRGAVDESAGRSRGAARPDDSSVADVVDLESADSFPASDPPSWTPVTGPGTADD